jgi:hypothetical protein
MFYTFASIVEKSWSSWAGLFAPLPYGETFVAGFALFFIVAVSCKMVADGRI